MRRWAELGALARGTAVEQLGLPDGAALGDPELTFRSERRWTVRLARPDASGRTGRGVLVEFDGAKVTGVGDVAGR